MKQIIKNLFMSIIFVFAFTCIYWGSHLVFQTYENELRVVYMWKTGAGFIQRELKDEYKEKATKETIVHLGLIIFGTAVVSSITTRKYFT